MSVTGVKEKKTAPPPPNLIGAERVLSLGEESRALSSSPYWLVSGCVCRLLAFDGRTASCVAWQRLLTKELMTSFFRAAAPYTRP